MEGEYWKAIESELKRHEESERRKALEEKLRSEKALREKQRLEKEAFHEKSRLEEEVRQRKEIEEKEIKEILSQARSILLPMFQEVQTNVSEIKNAPKSRIIEESDYYISGAGIFEMIRLQYGEKFELTSKEKSLIRHSIWDQHESIQHKMIKLKKIFFELPEKIIEFNFKEIGFYYDKAHLWDSSCSYFSNDKAIDILEFIQNPKIIIPNLVNQLKSSENTHFRILCKGKDYFTQDSRSYDDSPIESQNCS